MRETPNPKFQAPSRNLNPNHQNNVRPIEILGLGFIWDLVSWDLGFRIFRHESKHARGVSYFPSARCFCAVPRCYRVSDYQNHQKFNSDAAIRLHRRGTTPNSNEPARPLAGSGG